MVHTEYYADGAPCECEEMRRICFHNSDALLGEVPIVNGKIHGIKRVYYYSGALHGEIPFKNDLRQGTQRIYYESGALESVTPHVKDRAHGLTKSYKKVVYFVPSECLYATYYITRNVVALWKILFNKGIHHAYRIL